MYLSVAIDTFNRARIAEGLAPLTVRNNQSQLRHLLRHTGDVKVESINATDIDGLFAELSEKLSPDSINQIQATLVVFFRWCRTRKVTPIDHDPIGRRRMRKVQRQEKPRLAAGDFSRFLDCANNPRDRAMLAVGLYLFLRQSEIADLKVGDLNLDGGDLRVRIFKTKDQDVMPLASELAAELRTYMAWYAAVSPRPLLKSDYLFPARSPEGAQRDALGRVYHTSDSFIPAPDKKVLKVEQIVRRAFEAYGWDLDLRIGMHDLRRSGARALFDELVNTGYDGALRTVQAFLHHATTGMTEKYLGIQIDRANRDKRFKGQPMFASRVAGGNVIELRRADG